MENITAEGTYWEFKQQLDREFKVAADSFVRIGYLLKIARDTNILYESGYESVLEFAKAEYGLSKDNVSRYIAINDRFSENGYGEKLRTEYQGYGVAKLAELLTLPDAVIEEIGPEVTRREIQEVKREIREELERTDIEVMLEGEERQAAELKTEPEKFIFELFREHRKEFVTLLYLNEEPEETAKGFMDSMAPAGHATYTARVQGLGKFLLVIRDESSPMAVINTRTNEKTHLTAEDFVQVMQEIFEEQLPEEVKTDIRPAKNNCDFEKAAGIAWDYWYKKEAEDIQAEKSVITETREVSKETVTVTKAAEEKVAPVQPDEEQLPGQTMLTQEGEIIEPKIENIHQEIGNGRTEEEAVRAAEEEEREKRLKAGAVRQVHYLKIADMYYKDVLSGIKTFELQKNDRNYKVNDTLILKECTDGHETGRAIEAEVTFMLEDYTGLTDGYCILAIKVKGQGMMCGAEYRDEITRDA